MMKEIRITRAFLKKPLPNVLILFSVALLIDLVGWIVAYEIKLERLRKIGGVFKHIVTHLLSIFLPELVTLSITLGLINYYHKHRKITTIECNWQSITRYELQFLPFLIIAYPFYNIFTQTFRYFIENLPFLWFREDYSWPLYWKGYLLKTYTWKYYSAYLFPVALINYLSINISLLQDYIQQRREKTIQETIEEFQKTILTSQTLSATLTSSYLNSLKGKNTQGELTFAVNDVFFFTIQERAYYAQLGKGQYFITKTLNELEIELDPNQFFRIKRDYIVNRQAILGYTHWENGKYVVRIDAPVPQQITIPRARMQELREWLQKPQNTLSELS